jgi:endogenous inhibitor of DNA gyrase (YacG/DUF329 family)
MAQESGRKNPALLKCPTCRKQGDWFAGPYGPFCSRRCKLVDLGKWFGEEHAVSEPLRPEHLEGFADLPPGPHLDDPSHDQ